MNDFTKHRDDAPAGFFAWEAAGLRWLAEPVDGPRVVEVRGAVPAGARSIGLERLHPTRATRESARRLGAGLARLHASGAEGFGAPPPGWPPPGAPDHGWIGRQRLALAPPGLRWGEFYAELRVLPYLRAATDLGRFDREGVALVESVCERLRDGEWDDDRPPARIHGDLWGGNVVHTRDGAVLIDPAAHGGHGETDLAMLALFGTEHLADVEEAYASEAGLDRAWRERTPLHQLHPVLVHAVSHGPSYAAHALELARACA